MQWIVDSYNLMYALLLLSGGLLADLYGRKRIFQTGVALFAVASLLCGLASNVALLVVGRVLAGIGAAMLTPASLAILRVAWPDTIKRGKALGIWAACNGLAFAVAPTLGGYLITTLNWRSIFILAIPVCVLALILARRSITESHDPNHRHFDMAAQLLGALSLGGLALAAIEIHQHRMLAIASVIVSSVALILFRRIEARKGDAAMVPLALFRIPALRGAIIATTGMTLGMYGVLFLQPLVWQELGTLNATEAGLALMPMALIFVAVSPFTGRFTQALGTANVACLGVFVIGAGLLVIGLGAGRPGILYTECGLTLTGIGMGLATGPLMGMAVGAVSASRSGTASALINVARISGATIGVAVLGALYASQADPVAGLRLAMLCGGGFQILCALVSWGVAGKN